jgi:hypothetical protein
MRLRLAAVRDSAMIGAAAALLLTVGLLTPPVASATSATTATWSIQSTPTIAGSTGSALSGVSCTTGTACVGVGDYVNGSGADVALAERWNGTAWSVLSTPVPTGATGSALAGVFCATTSACAAVGYVNASGVKMTLVERWDGSKWSIQTSANPTGGGVLSSVSCRASQCIAVGQSAQNTPLAERWNGTAWVIQTLPAGSGILSGLSCTAANACTAVGQRGSLTQWTPQNTSLAERWNGTAWSIQTTPNANTRNLFLFSSRLSGVSCTTATGCIAVGYWSGWRCNNGKPTCNCFQLPYCTHLIGTLVEAWNGTTWAIQGTPSPGEYSELLGVSCVSATACTATGGHGSAPLYALAEQWNGTAWTYQFPPNPLPNGVTLLGVSCTAVTACTAVGETTYKSPFTALVERYSN